MKIARTRPSVARSDESGLTLVEVLVAVVIIAIVALSGAGLSVNGIQTATAQQRQQVAITIANAAMENISGWGVGNLYTGRFSTTVTNAFTTNASQPGVSQTYPGWDATATSSSVAAIPIVVAPPTAAATQNGTQYTTTALIGSCYEPVAGGTCSVIAGYPTAPGTTPAGYVQLVRAIVLVKWTAGSKCAAGCYYEASTLADPHADLTWLSH